MSVFPLAPDRTRFVHRMLVPSAPVDVATRERFDRSFALIDGQVFGEEDLGIAESIQSTVAARGGERFVLGGLERGVAAFHAAIEGELSRSSR